MKNQQLGRVWKTAAALSVAAALALTPVKPAEAAVPVQKTAAAAAGSVPKAEPLVPGTTQRMAEVSLKQSLSDLFHAFLHLFTGENSESTTETSSDSSVWDSEKNNTFDDPEIRFSAIDPDKGTFTLTAEHIPFSDSVTVEVWYGSDTDGMVTYDMVRSDTGTWTAEGDVTDFGCRTGLYHASVPVPGTDSVLVETKTDVDLQNYVYAVLPEDGYGTAKLYDVNPVLSDGTYVSQVQFAVTLESGQKESGTEEPVNENAKVMNTEQSRSEGSDASEETVRSDSGNTGSEESDSEDADTEGNTETKEETGSGEIVIGNLTQQENSADAAAVSAEDTETDGETQLVYNADRISGNLWEAEIAAADFSIGGQFSVTAYAAGRTGGSDASSAEGALSARSSSDEAESEEDGDASDPADNELVCDSPAGASSFSLWVRTSGETEVPELLQNPELPTGCESVALTIVLKSLGFDLDKTTIADDYLIHGKNFAVSFVGNPRSSNGSGIFPPGLVKTANAYLAAQDSSLRAEDVSGTDFDSLTDYIDQGIPVLVWTTMYMDPVKFSGNTAAYNGHVYRWYRSEHCVVLCGYDREKGTITVSDPLEGRVERNWDAFSEIYDEAGQYAVVIR